MTMNPSAAMMMQSANRPQPRTRGAVDRAAGYRAPPPQPRSQGPQQIMQMLAMIQAGQQAEKRLRQQAEQHAAELQQRQDELDYKKGQKEKGDTPADVAATLQGGITFLSDIDPNNPALAGMKTAYIEAVGHLVKSQGLKTQIVSEGDDTVDPNAANPVAAPLPTGDNNVVNEAPSPTLTGYAGPAAQAVGRAAGNIPMLTRGGTPEANAMAVPSLGNFNKAGGAFIQSMGQTGAPGPQVGSNATIADYQQQEALKRVLASLGSQQGQQPQATPQFPQYEPEPGVMTPEMQQKLAALQYILQQQRSIPSGGVQSGLIH